MPNRPRQRRDTNTYDKANRQQPEPVGTELLRRRGAANGYAPLDSSSLVPVANLPTLPGAASTVEVTVDFGAFDTTASTVVTGQAWVTAASKIVANVFGTEDALLDQVSVTISDRVVGVGFTVIAHAPEGSSGTHTVHVLGI